MILLNRYSAYRIGSPSALSERQMAQLVEKFEQPLKAADNMLEGRYQTHRLEMEGIGPVVVKQYARGGAVRHFNRKTYICIGKTRSRAEFELLRYLEGLHVRVLPPVAFAEKGRVFYQAWLVTREIPHALPLARLSLQDWPRTREAVKQVARDIRILIGHQVYHQDLHPGNVLVDPEDEIRIIDFDKAAIGRMNRRRLAVRYISRWNRAVAKYHLPPELTGILRAGLEDLK